MNPAPSQSGSGGATFVSLELTTSGDGIIRGTGSDCRGSCTVQMASGTQLQLQAIPDSGASFSGWSGACSGGATGCPITVNGDAAVTAAFSRPGPVQVPPPAIARRLSVMVEGSDTDVVAHFERGSFSIWAVPKAGGDPVRISSGLPVYIVADDSFVYWTDQQAVYSTPASGGPGSPLFAGAIGRLVLDEQGALYFAELRDFSQPRGIHRMQDRVDSVVAADQDPTGGITGVDVNDDFNWGGPRVDDDAVYYLHAGSLLKRLK
jgi:hypothetical protein